VTSGGPDPWASWLLGRRDGGSPELRDQMRQSFAPVRDRVIADAKIGPGDRVLDVGCGDGLIGLAAADLVGADGRVAFSDVSAELLDFCRDAAAERGIAERCEFVHTALPALARIPDGSVDAVTMRSVLIYVADKATAIANLHRVLCPGGRLALFEPINRLSWPGPEHQLWGFDIAPNPLAPSYREMLHHALGESERTRLIAAIREQFRLGRWHYRSAAVHLAATTG
jgi:arsenite methyltransferase